jgi:hypothetical protein
LSSKSHSKALLGSVSSSAVDPASKVTGWPTLATVGVKVKPAWGAAFIRTV